MQLAAQRAAHSLLGGLGHTSLAVGTPSPSKGTEPCPAPCHLAHPLQTPLGGGWDPGEPRQQAFTLNPTDGTNCSLQQLPDRGRQRAGAPSQLAQPWEEKLIQPPDRAMGPPSVPQLTFSAHPCFLAAQGRAEEAPCAGSRLCGTPPMTSQASTAALSSPAPLAPSPK